MVDSLPKQMTSSFKLSHESSYQKLLNRIEDFAWLMDIEGQVYLSNSAWEEYIGKSALLEESCSIWDVTKPEEKATIEEELHSLLATENVWHHRLHLRNKAGEYFLFAVQTEQLTTQEDNHSLLICTATRSTNTVTDEHLKIDSKANLAEYKRKELILMRQTEFVQRILESSPDCIKVLDLQGRLLYINDGGQDIMEIDDFDRQVRNTFWSSFWEGCDREAAEEAFAMACEGKVGKFSGYCTTAKGTPKWWEVLVTPMFDDENQIREILSVSRDITEHKVAQQTLQKHNQELEQFTYIVSHDLKAPLRGISSLSEMIIEDLAEQIPADNKLQLNLLQQRVLRMNALIDGLLKYSRVGKQEILSESVNMEELLQEVIDSLAPPKGFKINYPRPLPALVTKKLLLNQILANLIGNAIKHHHLDRGQIDLTMEDCGQHYQFAIADDGPGIPEEHRDRIFKIFQTLKNNTSTTNTGIGLALIRKIVDGEGGEFWLDSQTEKGAKFCFTWKKG